MIEFLLSGIIGCLLIALCSMIIYEILRFIWHLLPTMTAHPRYRMVLIIPLVFSGHIVNIWMFGFIYYVMIQMGFGSLVGNEIASGKTILDIYECIYFSAATYTTLGLGDLTPLGATRMITGVESLCGFLLIGWTVTFTYLAMAKFWELPHKKNKKAEL